MSKINNIVNGQRDRFVLLATIATALFNEKFYAGREVAWGKATSEQGKAAEAMFNDRESNVFADPTFAALIKVQTGDTLALRQPTAVDCRVGVVVVPTTPIYGECSKDGYEVGQSYMCVNESSGGKFRNAGNVTARMTSGPHNEVGLMSRIWDEVRPATEEEIEKLADELLAVKGLTLLQDILPDLEARDAHFAN